MVELGHNSAFNSEALSGIRKSLGEARPGNPKLPSSISSGNIQETLQSFAKLVENFPEFSTLAFTALPPARRNSQDPNYRDSAKAESRTTNKGSNEESVTRAVVRAAVPELAADDSESKKTLTQIAAIITNPQKTEINKPEESLDSTSKPAPENGTHDIAKANKPNLGVDIT